MALHQAPVIIGVAGGSGSGKTTVVRKIVEALGDDQVSVLEHDRYYRDHPELRLEERAALNYDHPASLETDLMVRHVEALREGRTVEVPVYDFARHARVSATSPVPARTASIVAGRLICSDAALRNLMDVKVFVDADDDTRFIRRLQRDVAELKGSVAIGREVGLRWISVDAGESAVVVSWYQDLIPMRMQCTRGSGAPTVADHGLRVALFPR